MASIPERNWAWNPIGQSERNDWQPPQWMDDQARWLAESRAKQARLNAQNTAMPSFQQPQQTTPMRGTFSVANPNGPTREAYRGLEGSPSWGGDYSTAQAPGYRPDAYSATPDQIATADAQWEARQRAWQATEDARNTAEDQSLAQSWARQGKATPFRAAPSPEMTEWQKYQDVMAQPYQRPEPPPRQPTFTPAGQMDRTGADYGILEHILNSAKSYYNSQPSGMDIGRRMIETGRIDPQASSQMSNQALMMAMGIGAGGGINRGFKMPEPWEPLPSWGRSGFKNPYLTPPPPGTPRSGFGDPNIPPTTRSPIGQSPVQSSDPLSPDLLTLLARFLERPARQFPEWMPR